MSSSVPSPGSALWHLRGRASLRRSRLKVLVPSDDYHVQAEVVRALAALGHEVLAVPLGEASLAGQAALEPMMRAIAAHAPDLVVSINYIGLDRIGLTDRLLASLEIPCALWFVDHPLFFGMGHLRQRSPLTVQFAWDRSHARALSALEGRKVHYLPLACEPERFAAAAARAADDALPTTFVGSSLVPLAAMWKVRLDAREQREAQAMADALLADRAALHALVPAPSPPPCRRSITAAYANCLASRAFRRGRLMHVAGGELAIFGDEAWSEEMPRAHCFPPLPYGDGTGDVFRRSTVNLNATILQMPSGVNQRVFDVPAAGGFLLTDAQADLFELFEEGTEVAVYRDGPELERSRRYYAARPRERAELAARARARILREHTYVHRLDALLGHMRAAVG